MPKDAKREPSDELKDALRRTIRVWPGETQSLVQLREALVEAVISWLEQISPPLREYIFKFSEDEMHLLADAIDGAQSRILEILETIGDKGEWFYGATDEWTGGCKCVTEQGKCCEHDTKSVPEHTYEEEHSGEAK